MSTRHPGGRSPRRLLAAVAAAVVAAVLAVLVLTLPGADADQPAAAAPSSAAGPTTPQPTTGPDAAAPAVPEPTVGAGATVPVVPGPTAGGDVLPPVLPAVDLDEQGQVGDGVTATVRSIEAIEGSGYGPGNIAGPALRVTVRLDNGTDRALDLGGVAVTLTTGADSTPASPLDDPSQAPFSGTVAAGDSATGVYVFTVPVDRRDLVTVSVGYRPGAPVMAFRGSL
jgi:hypothetical protein